MTRAVRIAGAGAFFLLFDRRGTRNRRYRQTEHTRGGDFLRGVVHPREKAHTNNGVKEEKSIRWMPWRVAAKKDVVNCEKPWGVVNRR